MKYKVAHLNERPWHKFVLHHIRHGERTKKLIANAKAFCQEQLDEAEWMFHTVKEDECALVFIGDDDAAMLFQLACIFHAKDIRGKRYWGRSSS